MIVIFSYNRPKMLLSLLRELKGNVIVMDDGSDFDPDPFLDYCDFYRSSHRGREGYWRQWRDALEICEESGDWFLFLSDDLQNVNLSEIKRITKSIKGNYAFNVLNVGADRGWTGIKWAEKKIAGVDCYKMGYVDGAFACNRGALESIGFYMEPVDTLRFRNPYISSGVGQQLSNRFALKGIPMYLPKKSLCYHGNHESKMNPEERKRNPLVSEILHN